MDVMTTSTSSELALLSIYVALGFFASEAELSDAETGDDGGYIGAASQLVSTLAAHSFDCDDVAV